MITFFVCDAATQSRITVLIGDAAKTSALAIELLLVVASIFWLGIARAPGALKAVAAGAGLLGLALFQMYIFVINSGSDFNFNGIGQFLALSSVALFSGRPAEMEGNLKILAYICAAYVLLYLLLWSWGGIAILSYLRINDDDDRGERIYLANMYAIFILNCGLRAKKNISFPVRVAFVAMAIAASVVSLSRVTQLVVLCCLFGNLFAGTANSFIRLCALVYFVVSVYFIYGIFDSSVNPYEIFRRDGSGFSRALQYDAARAIIWNYPIFGAGLAPNPEEVTRVASLKNFFSTDLGVVGLWVAFGIVGVIVNVVIILAILKGALRSEETNTIEYAAMATAAAAIAYGVMTPVFYASAQIFVALALSMCLTVQRRAASGEQRAASSEQ